MDKFAAGLTVFFEDPFWIGIFERISDGELSVCKVTFGSEPTNQELCDFITKQYGKLKFSPSVKVDSKKLSIIRNDGKEMLKNKWKVLV